MATFNHFDLALLNPAFDSPLVDVLNELEHLRRLHLAGTTPAPVFYPGYYGGGYYYRGGYYRGYRGGYRGGYRYHGPYRH